MLERGRDLLARLRQISDGFAAPIDEPGPAVLFDRADPLTALYRETAAMTDTALRMVPLFPQTATAQLYLCEGLEAILTVIAGRLKTLIAGVESRRAENGRIAVLVHLLTELEAGRPVDAAPLWTWPRRSSPTPRTAGRCCSAKATRRGRPTSPPATA